MRFVRVLRRIRRALMTSNFNKFCNVFAAIVFWAILACILFCPSVFAQTSFPEAPVPVLHAQPTLTQLASVETGLFPSATAMPPAAAMQPATTTTTVSTPSISYSEHKFWDAKNLALFAGSAAMSTADFAVTRSNLQSGGQELNPVVRIFGRSSAGLAVNFVGETAGVIGLTYFFHRTGHHRLERLVSVVNMSASAGAVSYGLTHR